MNKYLGIVIATVTSAFLLMNFYLLYSEESVIPKILHVKDQKRMVAQDYEQKLMKDALIAPYETHTVYVDNEDTVEHWYVEEGDEVYIGQELALLNTDRLENARGLWEVERDGLQDQQITLEEIRGDLVKLRDDSNSNASQNIGRDQYIAEVEEKMTIELGLNIGLSMDIMQEGSYTQAIAAVDQQLSDIERQLTVLDAQLAQDDSEPMLLSPVSGVVADMKRHGERLSLDIYDEEQIAVTYVNEKEWQKLEEGQDVKLQSDALGGVVEGDVLSVSPVPVKETDELFKVYEKLEKNDTQAPLAYYEVRISPDDTLDHIPYASNVASSITIDEAYWATAIPKGWGRAAEKDSVRITKLQENGRPTLVQATTPFTLNEQMILTDGVEDGEIVVHDRALYQFDYAPQVYLSFPSYQPKKEEWKTYGWRNYLKAMLIK